MRLKHNAYSTEKTIIYWAKRYVLNHYKRHPHNWVDVSIPEAKTYLTRRSGRQDITRRSGRQDINRHRFCQE